MPNRFDEAEAESRSVFCCLVQHAESSALQGGATVLAELEIALHIPTTERAEIQSVLALSGGEITGIGWGTRRKLRLED